MTICCLRGSRNVILFALIALCAQGAIADERFGRKSEVIGFVNSTLPPGSLADVNITNVGTERGRCSDATADFKILGTLSDLRQESFSSTPSPEIADVRLLHRRAIHLKPGQVERIAFSQPSSAKESIYFVTTTKPRFKKCFIQSPIAVSGPTDNAFTSVPVSPSFFPFDFNGIPGEDTSDVPSPGACCACVPVCDCGLCP